MPPQRDKRPSFMVACSRTSSEVSSTDSTTALTVRVRRFKTADPYASRRIVLQNASSGQIQLLKDGDFAVMPGVLASDTLRRWLADSKAFASVVDTSVVSSGDNITLDGWVEKLYVKEEDSGEKFLVLSMTIWVQSSDTEATGKNSNFIRETSVPLDSTEPAKIADAFGKALATVYTEFESWLLTSLGK